MAAGIGSDSNRLRWWSASLYPSTKVWNEPLWISKKQTQLLSIHCNTTTTLSMDLRPEFGIGIVFGMYVQPSMLYWSRLQTVRCSGFVFTHISAYITHKNPAVCKIMEAIRTYTKSGIQWKGAFEMCHSSISLHFRSSVCKFPPISLTYIIDQAEPVPLVAVRLWRVYQWNLEIAQLQTSLILPLLGQMECSWMYRLQASQPLK